MSGDPGPDGRRPIRSVGIWWAFWLAVSVLTGCRTGPAPASATLVRYEFETVEMAIPFRIVAYGTNAAQTRIAADAAFARIHELNGRLSDYDPESELSRLSQTAGSDQSVALSPDLSAVLIRARDVSVASDGAFDVTVGPLTQLWRRARRQQALPDPELLAKARSAVGWSALSLKQASGQPVVARLHRPGMRLDLGGIAKGFALDEATRILRSYGLNRTLITGAGDMVAGDPPPGERGWRIELAPPDLPGAPPAGVVLLRRGSLCTSGDLFQHVEIEGVRYSHIVDPHTGLGLTHRRLVTVIGPDGMTCDALSTAISVLAPERGLALARRFGSDVRILQRDPRHQDQVETWGTTGFVRHLAGAKASP